MRSDLLIVSDSSNFFCLFHFLFVPLNTNSSSFSQKEGMLFWILIVILGLRRFSFISYQYLNNARAGLFDESYFALGTRYLEFVAS